MYKKLNSQDSSLVTEAKAELVKRFATAGYSLSLNHGIRQFAVGVKGEDKRWVEINVSAVGKLYVQLDDAYGKTKLFYEKKGTLDYDAIVAFFTSVLATRAQRKQGVR